MTDDNNLVRRLREPAFGTETTERNLMGSAADRIEELEAKMAKAVDALQSVINACDQGRMIPRPGHGAGGMTIEANVKGSIYTGVPAWPIEEARTALAELKGDKP